ncbi:unnamed protein product (macronuclear) [Paramecium tetraurelia]|uniref:Uncharacterized protein n=1 Tax=Paramecium tetraurelia TaxID=5888 RepID=A0CXL2_PARTE|nr:uncharacterized protein GSPATT00011161001 [Paramecium tetraurelia]CAK75529.1 unnamed protein product [Paramecium tetraurelia]|eukprot:XP_001442926.1 hypothetical protein (macronuclear) [Paramecium tetraurelia strain d4-2]
MQQTRSPLSPIDSNQNTYRSQASKTQDLNYQLQFQISKQKLSTVPDSRQDSNTAYMSPRNTKLKTQTFFSPNCRSPLTTRKEINAIQSPYNFSIHSAKSPVKIGNNVSQNIKSELDYFKQNNSNLQKQILNLTSEIQRGQSNTLIKELKQKIQLLTQMNDKLNQENKELQQKGNLNQLKQNIEQQIKLKKENEKKLNEIKENQKKYEISQFELVKNTTTDYITQLILDLEERVHILIIENANLNKVFNQKIRLNERFNTLELQLKQAQVQFQQIKVEEKLIKTKYNQIKKK